MYRLSSPSLLAGEGGPLHWPPSADAVAGNGRDGGEIGLVCGPRLRFTPTSPSPIKGEGKKLLSRYLEIDADHAAEMYTAGNYSGMIFAAVSW
jgi:hypothetical protein